MAECDPTRCPTGLAYKEVGLRLTNIEAQTAATHKVVTDQAVLLQQGVDLREDFKELKKENNDDHNDLFRRLRILEASNKTKITAKEALYYFGGTIAAIGGIIVFIKAVV